MPDIAADRLALLARFREMYTNCHFPARLIELDSGYLQTTLADDDRMSLRFFVDDNNAWWFAIISGVSVRMITYDPQSDSGSIVLDIDYDVGILQAMQLVHFGDSLINRISDFTSGSVHIRAHWATAPGSSTCCPGPAASD